MTHPSQVKSIHYATNVHHYDEALEAMAAVFESVTLQRRFEPTPALVDSVRRLPGSSALASRLARRVREAPEVDKVVGLGGTQLLIPAAGLLGRQASPGLIRATNHAAAKRTAKNLNDVDVFQFVEGLGHVALRSARGRFAYSVMERRNLHHHVFEQDPGPLLGFPQESKLDPLRDFLDTEYAGADHIVVYSSVAKKSFIDRGFEPGKLAVIPLAVHKALASGSRLEADNRGRVKQDLLYVGRGDAFKGLDVAVAASELLGSNFRLRVAGPASKEVVRWLDSFAQVDYLGVLSRPALQELYRSSGVLLAPSVESFGLAIIDAAATGLPIIARETTGAAEFLAPGQCRIVEGRDPNDWAAAILALGEAPLKPSEFELDGFGGLTKDASVEGFTRLLTSLI